MTPSRESAYVSAQGRYLASGEAFESHWCHGREFIYAVVLLDGPGLATTVDDRFGNYCLVVHDPTLEKPEAVGVFPGNSVERYAPPGRGGPLDESLCDKEATGWQDRADLLTVKHQADIPGIEPDRWGWLICHPEPGGDVFAEVVRAGELALTALSEVRIPRGHYRHLRRLHQRREGRLCARERSDLDAYLTL
ncbi:MAG: hypothetical protein QG597_1411 [Actinomycetota bacterium]|nr:hypothetical protein [Actinomycetota bacterium]